MGLGRRDSPPPRDFAALARSQGPAASDWALVPPTVGDDGDIRLSTTLAANAADHRRPDRPPLALSVGDDRIDLTTLEAGAAFTVGGLRGTMAVICAPREPADDCSAAREGGPVKVVRFTLTPLTGHARDVAIVARRVETLPERFRAVLAGEPGAQVVMDRGGSLQVSCVADAGNPRCEFGWGLGGSQVAGERHRLGLSAADGTPLLDEYGTATSEALALGLGPVVGWGAGDPRAIAAGLAIAGRDADRTRSPSPSTAASRRRRSRRSRGR